MRNAPACLTLVFLVCAGGTTALARPVATVCTGFIADGNYDKEIAATRAGEKKMAQNPAVIFRQLYQAETQKQLIWSITEWRSEKLHNDTAESLMKTRRDDRIAAAAFEPYRESFCDEVQELRVGTPSPGYVIVGEGIVASGQRGAYLARRRAAVQKHRGRIGWLRVYHNRYQPDAFFFFMGFNSRADYEKVRGVGELTLEEVLFTGLSRPGGMGLLASYNQFACKPLRP